MIRMSEYLLKKNNNKNSLDRWQIKPCRSNSDCFCVWLCTFMFAVVHAHTHRQRETEAAVCGRDSLMFTFIIETPSACWFVCLSARLNATFPPPPPPSSPVGGLGCRLWLRDPLLLCSPSWSQEGLRCRGQYYGTARRGTHSYRHH